MAKDKDAIKFDAWYTKPVYYLGFIAVLLGGPLGLWWIIGGILWYQQSNNKKFKNEKIIGAKHIKTGLQKFIYVIGWLAVVGIVLTLIFLPLALATYYFFIAGF